METNNKDLETIENDNHLKQNIEAATLLVILISILIIGNKKYKSDCI